VASLAGAGTDAPPVFSAGALLLQHEERRLRVVLIAAPPRSVGRETPAAAQT